MKRNPLLVLWHCWPALLPLIGTVVASILHPPARPFTLGVAVETLAFVLWIWLRP